MSLALLGCGPSSPVALPTPPSFVAAGTEAFSAINAATITPTLPTGWAANDIHVLLAARSDNTAMTALGGWTQIAALSGNNTAAHRVEVWWRRAVGGDTDPVVTFGSSTIVRGARIFGIRGCPTSGDPFHTSSRQDNAVTSDDIAMPEVTPSIASTYVLNLFVYNDDPGGVSAPPSPWSSLLYVRSSSGTDMGLGATHRAGPAAGVGAGAVTVTATSGVWVPAVSVGISIALAPA